jgi:transposase
METPDARSLPPAARQALGQRVIHAREAERLSQADAARTFHVHRSIVSKWWNAYRAAGAGALAARRRGRAPRPLLAPEQEARLLAVLVGTTPKAHGLSGQPWTRDPVADWAACALGLRRWRHVWGRWLKARGLTPQKPARRAVEQDPEAVRRWLREGYPRVEAEAGG